MKNTKVSVIVPIYNTEKYLDRCVKSIVDQSYKDLEIILIDDGSPDQSPAKCDEWAKKDTRIKVIHKKNAGLGMARNTGIDEATGKYICFFDSDDYIAPSLIEECYFAAEEQVADMVCFGYDRRTPDEKIRGSYIPTPPKNVFCGNEILEELLPMALAQDAKTGEDWNLCLCAWGKFFSLQTIKESGWRFVSEREILSEDYYSLTAFFQYLNKVVILEKVLYHYTVNIRSLSRSYRADRYEKVKHFAKEITKLSQKMGCADRLQAPIQTVFSGFVIGAMKQIVGSPLSLKQKIGELQTVLSDQYLQDALMNLDYSGENLQKKVLFRAMKRKSVWFCCFIIKLKNMQE